jgi:hypothetical protein
MQDFQRWVPFTHHFRANKNQEPDKTPFKAVAFPPLVHAASIHPWVVTGADMGHTLCDELLTIAHDS